MVTVTFYGRVTEYTNGEKSFTPAPGSCSFATLRGLFDVLCSHYGEGFESFINGSETCLILINGSGTAYSGGMDSPLGSGDKVEILPFVDAG